MAPKALPSPEVLRQLLRYEPETGKLFWLRRDRAFFLDDRSCSTWNTRWADQEAFTYLGQKGYKISNLLGFNVKAHRVAMALHLGKWPSLEIDHINGDRGDNRLSNLRLATRSQNRFNSKVRKDSASGIRGVRWDRKDQKWAAVICAHGVRHWLGYFQSKEEAKYAYQQASIRMHGEFGRPQ